METTRGYHLHPWLWLGLLIFLALLLLLGWLAPRVASNPRLRRVISIFRTLDAVAREFVRGPTGILIGCGLLLWLGTHEFSKYSDAKLSLGYAIAKQDARPDLALSQEGLRWEQDREAAERDITSSGDLLIFGWVSICLGIYGLLMRHHTLMKKHGYALRILERVEAEDAAKRNSGSRPAAT